MARQSSNLVRLQLLLALVGLDQLVSDVFGRCRASGRRLSLQTDLHGALARRRRQLALRQQIELLGLLVCGLLECFREPRVLVSHNRALLAADVLGVLGLLLELGQLGLDCLLAAVLVRSELRVGGLAQGLQLLLLCLGAGFGLEHVRGCLSLLLRQQGCAAGRCRRLLLH